MVQQTNPTLSRGPASIRKMTQILKDPTIFSGIAVVAALVGLGTWYYYSTKRPARIIDQHTVKYFKLIEKIPISHNTNIYRIALPCKDDVLGLPVGQHVTLIANIDGKEVSRSYTPTSNVEDKGYFELLIKTYENGALTQHISKMQIGDKIGVRGPKGAFTYTPNMVKEIGMIAGGTGITPMLQIVNAILRNPADKTKIKLIFGNVTKKDILLEKELAELCTNHPNQLQVYHVLNEAPTDEPWVQGVGFITRQILEEQLPKASKDVKVLVCGPLPLVKSVTNATTDMGFEQPRSISKLTDQVFKF